MTDLLEELDSLAIKMDSVVAFAAHFAKGNAAGKQAIDRVSGSGVFARFPDTIVIATEHKMPDRYAVEIITRSFPEQPSFVVKWDFPLMTVDAHANPNDLATAHGPTLDRVAFIRLLAPCPLGAGEWKYKAVQTMGLNVNSFGTLRSEVVAKGWVKGSHKEGYSLTPAGLELVQEAIKGGTPVLGEDPQPEIGEEKDNNNPCPDSEESPW
jgi:hypothetical protein